MRAIPVNFPSPFCSHPPLLFTAYSVQPNCSSWFIERFSCLDTCGYALYTYEKLMVGIVQIRRKQRALVKIKKKLLISFEIRSFLVETAGLEPVTSCV